MATNNKGYLRDKDNNILYPNIYPVGVILITSTNVNPSSLYGGTWELVHKISIDKSETSTSGNTIFVGNSNVSSFDLSYVLANNQLRIRLILVNAVDITDTTTEFGTINTGALGLTGANPLKYYNRQTSNSDSNNGVAYLQINAEGDVTTYDYLTRAGTVLVAGSAPIFDGTFPIPYANLLDSFCKEWHWKRTA